MASTLYLGLGETERLVTDLQLQSIRNLAQLEQAVAAMREGGVGDSILAQYEYIIDLATTAKDVAHDADTSLEASRTLRDAYAAVPGSIALVKTRKRFISRSAKASTASSRAIRSSTRAASLFAGTTSVRRPASRARAASIGSPVDTMS
jgi:hypothetical protein